MAIEVLAIAGKIINLGRAGENLATTVVFDVSSWIEEFGENGTFSLFVQQGTNEYYLQTVTGPLNGKVKWNITNNNTAIVGLGKCELSYTKTSNQDNIVVKSMIYDIMVTNALDIGEEGEMPDPIQSWIDHANEVLAEVQDTADWVVGPGGTPAEPSSTNNAQYYMSQASDFADAANSAKIDAVSAKNSAVSAKNDAVSAKTAAETAENNIKSLTAQVTSITNAGADPSVTLNTSTTPYKFEFTFPKGSQWFTGTGNPTTISGAKINDYYLNTTNGQIWKCTNNNSSSWSSVGNIKGTPGDNAPEITNIVINQSNYHLIITLSDGSSYDAGYCRGAAGSGSGDMTMAVYDTHGKQQDIYEYADAKYSKPSGGIPKTDLASAVQTSLGKADTALQNFTETDPTVPSWAKASTKPSYTASEVGALPDSTVIPQGTVTSIGIQNATNGGLSVSGSPVTSSGTITVGLASTYGDTKNPYGSKTKNYVLAAPSSAAGVPSFRALVAADIPTITTSKISDFPTIPSTAADVGAIANPSTKQNGNVLTYNGTNWVASEPATGLPDMTNKSGRYLYTDGQDADWMEIDALPNQSSLTNGQVLTSVYDSFTSTSSAEWQVLSGVTGQLSTPAIRNIYAGTADLTSSDTLPEGTIYLVYEA